MKWGMACPKDASGIWLDEQGEPVPVFTYTLDALGNATITGYTANPGVMVIPEKVDEHPVVAVGKEAFKNKTNLISVILPEGIETLEQSCFEGCRGITAINIPDSVTEMGENVFMNCSGLYEVTLPVNKKYTEIGKYILREQVHYIPSICHRTLQKLMKKHFVILDWKVWILRMILHLLDIKHSLDVNS